MKRCTTSAAAVRAAVRAGIALENLELRRLLSSGYQLASTITDTDHGQAYANFGRAIAVQGNLALIGSPGETAAITFDGGETFQPIDTTAGKVSLIDTSTGQVLHSFQNPVSNPATNSSFGTAVAFVDGKIAISAPGSNAVYVYDNYTDNLPEHTYSDGTDPNTTFGNSIAADGNDLLVSAPQGIDNNNTPQGLNGIVYRFDVSSGSSTPTATYFNPATNGANNDQFGYFLTSDGTNIYASTVINGTGKIISLDNSGNLVHVFQGESTDSQFGIAMATYQDPTAGRAIIISSPEDNTAIEYDAAGNVVRTFNMPHQDNVPFQPSAQSLAVSGDKLIAGDPSAFEPDGVDQDGNAAIYPFGEAYVFDIPTGNVDATISNPDRSDSGNEDLADQPDEFGLLAAGLPNGKFIITSPWNNNQNGIDAGTAYVYEPAPITPVNQPPTANAGAPQSITEGQTATLDGSGSTDPDGVADITSYSWDLNNDGTYGDATGVTTTFTPDLPGSYTIGLQVTDSAGHTSTATTTVNVADVAPTANAGGNQTGTEGTGVVLHGSGNNTAGDAIVAYAWDLDNNGTFETAGQNVNFNPDLPGTYTVSLRVTDDDGETATDSAQITITDVAPTANAGPSKSGTEGTGVSLSGSGTTAPGDSITSYAWDLDNNGTFETAGQNVSFNPDLPGNYTVKLQVTDDDGETAVSSASVTITDVAPTANAGPNKSGTEGTGVTLSGSGTTAPGDAIVSYAWDLDNNGTFETPGQNVNFNPDLPGNYTVKLQVTDDDGETAVSSANVTITDVAPTANAGPNQIGLAGQSLAFSGSGTTAPGDSITSYQWDFNYSGNPATFNPQASGANVSHAFGSAGNYTVALRVTDDDGETAISTLSVAIASVNTPVVAGPIVGPVVGVRQQSLAFSGSFIDPDAGDTHTVSWNFGDGTVIAAHSTNDSGAMTPSHSYLNTGTYTVTMTVRDAAGTTSSTVLPVNISVTAMIGGNLYVGGTTGADKITATKAPAGVNVGVNGPNVLYVLSPTAKVIIYGGDGNDNIQPNSDIPQAFEIYGGAGNDTLRAGTGNDILVGGAGNDQLIGDNGRDILIGGSGADALQSNNGDDILIAGETAFDNNPASLEAIMAEWASARTATDRMNNLRGTGTGPRLNGNVFLQADVNVFDDAAVDTLTSGNGSDWMFANTDLGIRDKTDAGPGDTVTDVDVIVV